MLKKIEFCLLILIIFLISSCEPVTNSMDYDNNQQTEQEQEQQETLEYIQLTYNKWGSGANDYNFQGYNPVTESNINFVKGYRCKISITLKSDVDIDKLNVYLVDKSQAANWWLEIANCGSMYGIKANNTYSATVQGSVSNIPKDISGLNIVFNTSHEAKLSDLQFSITVEEIVNTEDTISSLAVTYKIIEPKYEQKAEAKIQMDSMNKYGGYIHKHYYVDASFIYNKLDEASKERLRKCDFVFIDSDYLLHNGMNYYGLSTPGENLIFFCNSKISWSNYTHTELTLMHEMAHVLANEDHTINWAKKSVYIVEEYFKDEKSKSEIEYMINVIIGKYNFKYENGEVRYK